MKKTQDCLLISLIIVSATLMSCASILATSPDDPKGCNLSSNNQGCKLNRPIDFEREAQKHKFALQKGYHSLNFYKYN